MHIYIYIREETQRGGSRKGIQGKEEWRCVVAYKKEREKKLEHARQAKASMEENPDA